MIEPQMAFKGIWIPDFILEMVMDGELTPTDMMLLSMIFAMSKGENGCYASREYLASKLGVSVDHTKRLISKYRKMGIIIDIGFDGRRQKIRTSWDMGWHRSHGRGSVEATAEKTSSSPSSRRGGIEATAHQATNNSNSREIGSPSVFLEKTSKLGITTNERKELQKNLGVTQKALQNLARKYTHYCSSKNKPLDKNEYLSWVYGQKWRDEDYLDLGMQRQVGFISNDEYISKIMGAFE